MTGSWGDPSTDSFRKKHIREARPAGTVALVNAEILAVVSRMLEALSELHVEIPERIVSYDPKGTEAQRLGLAVHLPVPSLAAGDADDIAALLASWGFGAYLLDDQEGIAEIRFEGTPEQGEEMNDRALADKLDVLDAEEVSGPNPIQWPGSRDLALGDSGKDVEFLRLLLNVGDPQAPVDHDLLAGVQRFQQKRGAYPSGKIDADLWRRIIPAGRPQVGQSDSGFLVRVIQAALVAYEGSTHRVSGTWGVLTDRDIREMQIEYNLRVGAFVRAPEWAILIGPVQERVEEARAAARNGTRVLPEPEEIRPPATQTPPAPVSRSTHPTNRYRIAPGHAVVRGQIVADDLPPTETAEKPATKPRTARKAPVKSKTT